MSNKPKRSRSVPSNHSKSKSTTIKHQSKSTTIKHQSKSERPPFNLDTRIVGYDNVDDTGHIKHKDKSYVSSEKERRQNRQLQEQLNTKWMSSLRDQIHNK